MKIAFLALLFAFAPASFGQRFISGTEQEARLITPNNQRVLHSEFCPDNSAQVRLRLTINEQGQVVRAKEVNQSSYYFGQTVAGLKQLLKQASHLVLSQWHYKPLLVAGKPVSVVTFAKVSCTQ